MTHKQIQHWLMRGACAFALVGLVVLAWVTFVSIDVQVKDTQGSNQLQAEDGSATGNSQGNTPSLQQLQVFASIDLRRPLKDPPPVKIAPPPMQARLLGTIYEPSNPDQSQALFRMADGVQRFYKAGQTFNEPGGAVVIKRVGDQIAWVEYRDEQRELTVSSP